MALVCQRGIQANEAIPTAEIAALGEKTKQNGYSLFLLVQNDYAGQPSVSSGSSSKNSTNGGLAEWLKC
jgi:hypothetical protein